MVVRWLTEDTRYVLDDYYHQVETDLSKNVNRSVTGLVAGRLAIKKGIVNAARNITYRTCKTLTILQSQIYHVLVHATKNQYACCNSLIRRLIHKVRWL